ncbi:2,3-bisphosphoglycerate-independent phosphoglycerate mutase [Thermanaeromonas toyohensis ToBE]|uniref:2,3-bisphosphoglycerate-independent phosphoglycerate mutase n=1 Tax=Thermanaeromonas toyohensis ToBE TaxID=698762 RepID=A0A1W1VYP8_9FIRM|nr:2,3-bisphosphoglycerate-independent phosphoglycerate mutase [Thermanaeromonas toyohensis]SMB98489.1 2,3-bisphosphoglycerate-independent phosphoglycerate mutase [Thermanaeromonas toyohensis ToBE]
MKTRGVLVIADGLGDRPILELKGKTPLETANTPNLDRLACGGIVGLVDPYAPGVPCGTDVGTLCALGYDPFKYYKGRGPIEALGAGLQLEAGDVAFRCNFATIDEKGLVVDRRAGRIREGTSELASSLNKIYLSEDTVAFFAAGTEHRAVLVLRGPGLSPAVSDSDPGTACEGRPMRKVYPLDNTPEAAKTARLLQKFLDIAKEKLRAHPVNLAREAAGLPPANAVLTRGAGIVTTIPLLAELYKGLKGALIAGENTVLAIGRMVGLEVFSGEGITGSYNFDPVVKARLALELIKRFDLVIIHVKAGDLAGHDGRWDLKIEVAEKLDLLVGSLLDGLQAGVHVAITGDHSTPCSVRDHSGDPVPAAIWGPAVRSDLQTHFGERSCAGGGLGRITGSAFFNVLMDLMGFTSKLGA